VRLRNQFVPMDPRQWATSYDVQINVGLGTGQREQQLATLFQIATRQEQIIAALGPNNMIVSPVQYRNTLAKITELSGFKDVNEFWMDPRNAPPQEPQQPQVDPKVQAEMQKMQAEMQMAQQKAAQELQLQKEKMQMEFAFKREQMAAELQLRQQELAFERELRAQQIVAGANTSTNLPRV